MVSTNLLFASLAVIGLVSSDVALARNSFCCNDARGKLVCGDIVPNACHGRAYRVLDEKGRVVKEVEAPLTMEQRVAREAEQKRKQEEEKQAVEEKRRNQALLATYPNEKDIDAARDRALADFDKGSTDLKKRFDDAMKRKKKLDGEKEFYQKKPMPANLKKQVEDADNDIKVAQQALDERKAEADALQQKFEDDRKRYMELKYGKTLRTVDPAPPPEKAASPAPPPPGAAGAGRTTRTVIIRETRN